MRRTMLLLAAFALCHAFPVPIFDMQLGRRALIGLLGTGVLPVPPIVTTPPPKIAVVGPDGETGMRVVDILVSKGIKVRAIHHTPKSNSKPVVRGIPVEHVVCGMEDARIVESIRGCSAVICVAGVKPSNGNNIVSEFDTPDPIVTFLSGYANLARVCIELNVPRLVLLSSSCFYASKVCEYMSSGEETVKDMYEKAPTGVGYTIVHAGDGAYHIHAKIMALTTPF